MTGNRRYYRYRQGEIFRHSIRRVTKRAALSDPSSRRLHRARETSATSKLNKTSSCFFEENPGVTLASLASLREAANSGKQVHSQAREREQRHQRELCVLQLYFLPFQRTRYVSPRRGSSYHVTIAQRSRNVIMHRKRWYKSRGRGSRSPAGRVACLYSAQHPRSGGIRGRSGRGALPRGNRDDYESPAVLRICKSRVRVPRQRHIQAALWPACSIRIGRVLTREEEC
jgi:hypothetical protein